MGINKTVSKARLDTALANGIIKENDITFVKDTENYEGIVVGNGNNPLRFHTVPSPTSQDTKKILQVDNNGIPKWNTIEEKSTFDGSKTITENLNLGGSLNVTGAVTAQSMTLGSSPTTSSNNMQVPTTAWVNDKLNDKADINSPVFTGTPKAPTPTFIEASEVIANTELINKSLVFKYVYGARTTHSIGRNNELFYTDGNSSSISIIMNINNDAYINLVGGSDICSQATCIVDNLYPDNITVTVNNPLYNYSKSKVFTGLEGGTYKINFLFSYTQHGVFESWCTIEKFFKW